MRSGAVGPMLVEPQSAATTPTRSGDGGNEMRDDADIALPSAVSAAMTLGAGGAAAVAGYVAGGVGGGLVGLAIAMVVISVAVRRWGGRRSTGVSPQLRPLVAVVAVIVLASGVAGGLGASGSSDDDGSAVLAPGECAPSVPVVALVEPTTPPGPSTVDHTAGRVRFGAVRIVEDDHCRFAIEARATLISGPPVETPYLHVAVLDQGELVATGVGLPDPPPGTARWEVGETLDVTFETGDRYASWDEVAFSTADPDLS